MEHTINESINEFLLEKVLSIKPTARIKKLRADFLQLKPLASIARARIETRIMKKTEGKSVMTRRARVFAATCKEFPIYIFPGQLIVGNIGAKPLCASVLPGHTAERRKGGRSYILGIKDDAPFGYLSDDDRKELENLFPYWKEQGRIGKNQHYGHNIHNHQKVVRIGFLGIKEEAEERLERLDLDKAENAAKVEFLECVIMAMDAAVEVGGRFAILAREMAEKEENTKRKSELLEIAGVCDRVPAHPARTFREALQSYYLSYVLLHWEVIPSIGFSQGRIDQYLNPYYEADIKEGRITPDEALELIDCYLLALNFEDESSPISVGGVLANGSDATNDLSYLIIEGVEHTRLPNPWLSVIVHHKMPDDLLIKACELAALGTGQPQFVSSDVMVEQALARTTMGGPPVSLKDARNASPQGCFELVIPGKDSGYLYYSMPNFAACLEYVLTNGIRRIDKKKIGLETGDPRKFQTFEQIQDAYIKQLAAMRKFIQITGTQMERKIMEFTPTVFESALIDGCIEKGICREYGGAYYNFNNGGAPLASTDVADSLTAIRKLVFEDKKITMAQLCDAVDTNFEGHDKILQMLINAPKFGNDDDYADEQAAWVLHQWMVEFNKITNLRGGVGCPGGSVMGSYVPQGKIVGALPSGRLAGEPLVDASSPARGMDVNGPTAVINSMGKIDHVEILGGVTFNLRIDPAIFEDGNVERMVAMVRSFIDQKIFHMQLNVINTETLREAQREPVKYRDLVVKVAGYNAFFTQLTEDLQNTIIARREHGL